MSRDLYAAAVRGGFVRATGRVLRVCRVSVAMLVIAAAAFIVPGQSVEVFAILANAGVGANVLVIVAALLWAHNTWYFARVLCGFRFADTKGFLRDYQLRVWMPRVLGALPFAILAAAFRSASWKLVVLCALLGITFFMVVTVRRRWLEEKAPPLPKRRELRELPRATIAWLVVQLTIGSAMLIAFVIGPVTAGRALGSPAIILIALASWIAFGSAIQYCGARYRFPVFVLLGALSFICSFWNDNHRLDTPARTSKRLTLHEDFQTWHEKAPKPWIIVVTEGGGIRAAYWTSSVLAQLQTTIPGFADHVYAISSVSGGSLGSGVFAALLAAKTKPAEMVAAHKRALAPDALGPVIGMGLFPDLAQRFFPIGISWFDRARALEGAWSQAILETTGKPLFDEELAEFQARGGPRLFLNATNEELGNRVIASPVITDFPDAIDLEAKHPVTLVQGIHLSARFAYVSPAARFDEMHVVDGGYFENSGAATAMDIADRLAAFDEPIFVVIRYEEGTDSAPASFANEALAPLRTLFDTKDARARLAVAELERRVGRARVVDFVLANRPGLPLGWVLGEDSRNEIDAALEGNCHNKTQRARLEALLER